jgi:CheY-like chemotaxis protein
MLGTHDETVDARLALVVDDEEQVRIMLQGALGAWGYEVETVGDGAEALRRLARQDYDVVICDLLMPHMTGDQVFQACQEQYPEIASRFVFLSAFLQGLPCGEFVTSTGQPVLPKPCRLQDVQAAVEAVQLAAPRARLGLDPAAPAGEAAGAFAGSVTALRDKLTAPEYCEAAAREVQVARKAETLARNTVIAAHLFVLTTALGCLAWVLMAAFGHL